MRSTYDPERRCLVLHKGAAEDEVAKRWDDG